MILIQFPTLTVDFYKTSDQNGNRVTADDIRQKLGLSKDQKFEEKHFFKAPDAFTFKTEYINEIPLYDFVQNSVI